MAQSWFYLTLWHGTPDEFTSKYNAEITPADNASTDVYTDDDIMTAIETTEINAVDIDTQEITDVDINIAMGVVWCVG